MTNNSETLSLEEIIAKGVKLTPMMEPEPPHGDLKR